MNRYATDLIKEQSKKHEVALLYPKGFRWWQKKCAVSKSVIKDGIKCYRLVNAEPVPLMYGIKNPKEFQNRKILTKSFEKFYCDFKPKVLHLHTLMGMPEEVLKFFKEKNVRIVYTSHDYFGICPKVNFINEEGKLCERPSIGQCAMCNAQAPSTLFLRIRNSSMAFRIRDFVRWLKNILNF
ncbi:MAG: hypothetical protein K2I86_02890 [Prevotella sp.]|nr:hypothetical protein [Prevotella sp.]